MVGFRRKVEFSSDKVERVKRESEQKITAAKERAVKKFNFRESVAAVKNSRVASGVRGVSSTFEERTARFGSKPSKKSSKAAKSFAKKQFKGGLNF